MEKTSKELGPIMVINMQIMNFPNFCLSMVLPMN